MHSHNCKFSFCISKYKRLADETLSKDEPDRGCSEAVDCLVVDTNSFCLNLLSLHKLSTSTISLGTLTVYIATPHDCTTSVLFTLLP